MNRLDADTLEELRGIYAGAVDDIKSDIDILSQGQPTLRLENLQILLHQTETRIAELNRVKDGLLQNGFGQASANGIAPFSGVVNQITLNRVSESSIRFINEFKAGDGLQLSDRIWRVDRGAIEGVRQSIQSAVIKGNDASRAAQDFLNRGIAVPASIQANINAASPITVGAQIGRDLLTDKTSAYRKAARVFRTEINRTHVETYRNSAFEHPDVVGTRFLLSPNHPEPDICDMHARVNRFGIGQGVYPKGKSPLPAHPNTLSYEVVVFRDEVTQADKDNKENRIDWLNDQPTYIQEHVLGGNAKRVTLEKGLLSEGQIATPWIRLKPRLEKLGHNTADWAKIAPVKINYPPGRRKPVSNAIHVLGEKKAVHSALAQIDKVHDDGRLPLLPVVRSQSNEYNGAFIHYRGGKPKQIAISRNGDHKEFTAVHELGHFIDHSGIGRAGTFASENQPELMQGWVESVVNTRAIRSIVKLRSKAKTHEAISYYDYLLQPREIWARSYAQYIAKKSGDPILMDQLQTLKELPYPMQWSDDDFDGVSGEIDTLFKELKWLKN